MQLVDCDVHACINSIDDLTPYLPEVWQRYVRETGFKAPTPISGRYPKMKPYAARDDSHPPNGGVPGADLDFLRKQHLDHWQIDRAVITPIYAADGLPNVDFGAALCSAHNDYMIENWYEKDDRIYGSILVPYHDPQLAIREIERVGDHPRVLQVFLMAFNGVLYGNRRFHPIWKAAEEHDLALAIHFGGTGQGQAAGDATYYIEYHTNMTQAFMSHAVNLVVEGTFTTCPNLRVLLLEGGVSWLPPLMWRLDKNWRGCRMEVPWVDRPPSEIIREHFRVSTQPIEEPDDPQHLTQIFDMLGSDEMLLFATDYPHWDFDSPTQALPNTLSPDLRKRIFSQNAIDFYGLK